MTDQIQRTHRKIISCTAITTRKMTRGILHISVPSSLPEKQRSKIFYNQTLLAKLDRNKLAEVLLASEGDQLGRLYKESSEQMV